jgi:3-dehydroshikimate dehydratase
VFGLPSGEHERYVGKRGTGVVPSPGSLAKMCPDGAPNCQAPPNGGLAAPTLGSVRKRAGELIVQGELRGKPLSRFTVEIFGNRAAGSGEGEMFLAEVATTSDAEGRGRFSLTVDAAKLATMPASFTATLTSADGATSEFSQPVALSE